MLDGVVAAAFAALAGAAAVDAARIGLAMTVLQFGIGATNDVVDAPRDAGHKPGKPIPAGHVTPSEARLVAVVAFSAGMVLAIPSGAVLAGLAVLVVGIGLAYDLRLKGTAWSWLPFAVGIPLLPVFGWVGAGRDLSPAFAILVPAAVAAGAALAIGNALVDVERDRAVGTSSVAVVLGPRAGDVVVALLASVVLAAVGTSAVLGSPSAAALVAAVGVVPVAAAVAARGGGAERREWAWRGEAIGIGLLAIVWIAGFGGLA